MTSLLVFSWFLFTLVSHIHVYRICIQVSSGTGGSSSVHPSRVSSPINRSCKHRPFSFGTLSFSVLMHASASSLELQALQNGSLFYSVVRYLTVLFLSLYYHPSINQCVATLCSLLCGPGDAENQIAILAKPSFSLIHDMQSMRTERTLFRIRNLLDWRIATGIYSGTIRLSNSNPLGFLEELELSIISEWNHL